MITYHVDGFTLTIVKEPGEMLKAIWSLVFFVSSFQNEDQPLMYMTTKQL